MFDNEEKSRLFKKLVAAGERRCNEIPDPETRREILSRMRDDAVSRVLPALMDSTSLSDFADRIPELSEFIVAAYQQGDKQGDKPVKYTASAKMVVDVTFDFEGPKNAENLSKIALDHLSGANLFSTMKEGEFETSISDLVIADAGAKAENPKIKEEEEIHLDAGIPDVLKKLILAAKQHGAEVKVVRL